MIDTAYLARLYGHEGKTVLITGGLGKLGTHFAEAFARAGAQVALLDIATEPSDALAALMKEFPIRAFRADLTDEGQVASALQDVETAFGIPDVLINNAGWKASPNDPQGAGKPFTDYSMELWDEVFRINLKSAAICSKQVGARMIDMKKPGVILNVSSHYSLVAPDQSIYDYKVADGGTPFIKDAAYGASKAAMNALSRDLAGEWGKYGIRVLATAFGGVNNPKSDPRFREAYMKNVPLGRMARPDEYAGLMLFLASDAASYMTGSVVIADGGWTAW